MTDKKNKETKLKLLLEETNEKVGERKIEPVAVGVLGIRKRSDIFEKELSSDYSNNKIIKKNTLCFGIGTNKIVYDVLLEDEIFCVSPAYKTFNVKNIDSLILKLILDVKNKHFSNKHMIISARQGKSVDFEGLLEEKIFIPDMINQEKIRKNINLFNRNLEKLKENHKQMVLLKKYFLANLFI